MKEGVYMMDVFDVANELGVSKGHAYKIIRQLNEQLAREGYIVIAGKVPKNYWKTKFFGYEQLTRGV